MFSMIHRGALDQPVQEEFEHLFAKLRGFLSQSFDEDGNLIVAPPDFAIVPIGGLVPFAGTSEPAGYLLCDGRQVNRATYKPLFDVIGTSYGIGDGTTTFTIPDLRQRFPLGKAATGTGSTLGQAGGAIDHVHGGGAHQHAFAGGTTSGGDHTHLVNAHQHTVANHTHDFSARSGFDLNGWSGGNGTDPIPVSLADHQHDVSGTTSSAGGGLTSAESPETTHSGDHSHNYGGTTSSAGGVTDPANPPFLAVNYLIYTGVLDAPTRQRLNRRF